MQSHLKNIHNNDSNTNKPIHLHFLFYYLVMLQADECGYMGDDWPDLAVMRLCGFAAAPANAHAEVLQRVHFVAGTRGGAGAVREVCDAILRAQDKYDGLLAAAIGA